jgi:glycerophosphoryl diester phosphodiesterase
MKRPHVIAHRGSSASHPDNSRSSFAAAVAEGADAIECDVQASADGVLIVRHDLMLGGAPIAELSCAEIQRRDREVMTLRDLLAWARGAPIDLLVESKVPAATESIARAIRDSGHADGCVLGSFHGPALAAARQAVPVLRTSFMMGSVAAVEELVPLCAAYRVDGVHLCWEARAPRAHALLLPDMVERLAASGLAVTLWHEERVDELCALVALGPDAICTNTPAVLRRIVDAAGAQSGDGRASSASTAPDAARVRPAASGPRPQEN